MMHFEIVQELDKMEAYHTQWDHLFNSGGYEASLSFEWTQALLKTHLGKDRFFLIVLKEGEEIVGIVPLVIKEVRKYGFSLAMASPIAEQYHTNSDLLLKDSSRDMVDTFLRALFSLPARWDFFWIKRFVEGNPLPGVMEGCLRDSCIQYDSRRETSSFYLNLDGTFFDYLQKRSANFRYNLKRKEKKVRALGNVEYCKIENSQSLEEAYKNLLYVEENSWKHKHGTAITAIKKQRALYKELCESTAKKGWLHLSFLFLNNEPIAYNLGLVIREKYYLLKLSFHEKYKQVSPAILLMAWVIEDLIHGGVKAYDFTGKPYEYESQWTQEVRWHRSLTICNRTLRAKLYSIYKTLKNKHASGMEDDVVYYDSRDLKPDREA